MSARDDTANPPVIDVHSHYVPKGWPELERAVGAPGPWPSLRIDSEDEAMMLMGEREFRRIQANAWDVERRVVDMDADGVDIQLVSPTPFFFSYARPGREAAKVATIFNDLATEICAPLPERFLPFCQVPLQDADAACEELDRCLANGHVGVEIGNHIGDRDLDDEGVITFLQHCAEVGAPVFVHPWDMTGGSRLDRWMAQWLVGMPQETHLSILALVLGGGFDRIPESLRICFAHGGGSFAFWCGRMDNAWHGRHDIVGKSEHPPSQYLQRFSVDSVVFSQPALRLLVDSMGHRQVMLGSDYPYPLGERPAGAAIRAADFVDETQKQDMLGGNATRFLHRPGIVSGV